MSKSVFDNFTNLYSLSKTLRFELRPVENTQKMLEDDKVFEKDKLIQEKYTKTKPYFDRLHREFVEEALAEADISGLPDYFEIYKKWTKDKKKYQKDIQGQEQVLRKEILVFLDGTAKYWAEEKYSEIGIKKKDIGIFFEEDVFAILKQRYGADPETQITDETSGEIVSIFDSWKGFTGYFTKFQETRKNLYKDDGIATAHATRIIDQNLKRFCDNLEIIKGIRGTIEFSEAEDNFKHSIDEIFSLDFYNKCLLQDGIDFYNKILGGEVLKDGTKLKGINELINKYRQDNKGEKIPFLKLLDRQILSEKEDFLDGIENDEELLSVLKRFYKVAEEKTSILKSLIQDFVQNNNQYNLAEIYISKEAFNTISRKWTNETAKLEEWLYGAMKSDKPAGLKYDKKEESYKFPDFLAVSYIKTALEQVNAEGHFWKDHYYKNSEENNGCLIGDEPIWGQFLKIFQYEFQSLFEKEIIDKEKGSKMNIGYNYFKKDFSELLDKENFSVNQKDKISIKNFADTVLNIYQMAKYFAVEKKRKWLNEYDTGDFYENPEFGYKLFYSNAYEEIVQTYNHLRNYLTKKPYSQEKWKLNFENSSLLTGWPDSPEGNTQYCSFIFRRKGKYFLGITDFSKLFDSEKFPEAYTVKEDCYEKMIYKQVDAKTLYGSVYKGLFGTKYSDDQEALDDRELTQRIKQVLETRVKFFPEFQNFIKKIDESVYEDAKSLAREISDGSFYKISFVPVNTHYTEKGIHEVLKKNGNVEKKKLYLFEIHNKDWNLKDGTKKIGAKNLHTHYFESLFSDDNIQDNFPIKLNGQAEVFYRPKTDEEKLGKKKDKKDGEVINHKRYAKNKIFFHVPLTLNREKRDISNHQFNIKTNDFLANNPDINIIGVDRGEKHLAYYSGINQKAEILRDKHGNSISGSLNFVGKDASGIAIDYHKKLEEKAANREQSRRDWQAVQGIKDLKKGYISQVVRKLADLAIEHNAIILFEDLNMRFKQIRGGIEKSVYQQLEGALIAKLNFLVNKGEKDPKQAGNLLKAYQLAAPFTTFKDMGKQTGIIFYTQASYTSKIDPLTGWRPNLYLKYSNAEKAKEDIMNFSNIEFKNGRFEFTYDLKSFQKQKEYPNKTEWTLCSCVERFRWNRALNQNKGGYDHYESMTDNFRDLFEKYGIDYVNGHIKRQIEPLDVKGNEKFFKEFVFFFNLICQIRNTQQGKEGDENDFILSPVAPFFDSRKSEKFGENLPKNGDDNGAYNIARKGIVILNKISNFFNDNDGCEKMKWGDLYVSHKDWDNFIAP